MREPLPDMKSLKEFLLRAAKGIPLQLGQLQDSGKVLLPQTLDGPSRKRKDFRDPESGLEIAEGSTQQDRELAAIMMLSKYMEAEQDVANLDDLQEFSADDDGLDSMVA